MTATLVGQVATPVMMSVSHVLLPARHPIRSHLHPQIRMFAVVVVGIAPVRECVAL